MTTRAEAIANAVVPLAEAFRLLETLPVEEAARRAYTPTCGMTLAELTEDIRADREERLRSAS